jgi:tetratricopeptide (TPR) repeat protein
MDQSRLPAEWQFYFANLEALQAWREGAGQWAVRKFREALEVTGDPHRELRRIVAMNLASVYLQVGDYSEAISLMEGLSRKSPEAALIAGVAWIGQSKFGEAAKLFDEATDAFKSRRELLFHAALAWSKAGDKNKAIERMKKYVELVTPPASDISRRLLKEWRESK